MVPTRTFFIPFILVAGALADVQQRDTEAGQLLSRQSSIVPSISQSAGPACKSACDSVQANAQGCDDISCLCTDGNSDAFAKCFDCAAGQVHNATVTAQFQDLMDSYVEACKAGGVNVKSQKIRANGALSLHSMVGATAVGLVIVGVFSML
ncbi:hypothetical protein E1B28_008202 [Marasmius oreades]|uniref:Extracellular membrane protein CFEM domain-containing protein n=1 Tax=Marasmius oreades TaxID=181124 RepID=A0A9P7RY14_9AGAR|nr:uncharacterized protein E1B28_008202 [Marasmius oreades]KAG7091799.1 hypothetical protein E1B28_008202 [Marasmius oreades]